MGWRGGGLTLVLFYCLTVSSLVLGCFVWFGLSGYLRWSGCGVRWWALVVFG